MNYDVDYFIKKFEAIPEKYWGINKLSDGSKRCSIGHCGIDNISSPITIECRGLFNLFRGINVAKINNGNDTNYQQPTPKQRVLAALYDIKKKQQPEATKPELEIKGDFKAIEFEKAIKEELISVN